MSVPRRVAVWWADLDGLPNDPTVLSDDERARAARFRLDEDRERFIVGRTWTRVGLAPWLGCSPAEVSFHYSDLGKPLVGGGVEFNLSHAGRMAVLAVSGCGPVGVDLEPITREPLDEDSAALVLSPEELGLIASTSDPAAAFLRCWTRKEAYSKRSGAGLERSLAGITLTGPASSVPDDVAVHDLDVPGAVAALACAPDCPVSLDEWTDVSGVVR